MRKRFDFMKNRLAKTIVLCGLILIAAIFIILRYEGFWGIITGALHILRPIIIGGVIAFALNRPMNFFHIQYKRLFSWIKSRVCRKEKKAPENSKMNIRHTKLGNILPKHQKKPSRAPFGLACVTTYLLAIAIIVSIIAFIIPQLYDSIKLFGTNLNDYIKNFQHLLDSYKPQLQAIFGNNFDIGNVVETVALKLKDYITNLADNLPELLGSVMGFTSDIISVVVDLFMGIFFSVYILLDKENLKKNASDITKLVIKGGRYNKFEKIITMSYTTFSNFISGQLIEAAIVGALCFFGMSVFGFDYAPLISVIVGVTNLIPIAGPIIGTIPGAFILLLIKPIDALWFVIMIFVIQQTDANFIYPKVVGNKVGLPALWVLTAIVIGGGLAGVLGMILGVPILSIVYALLSEKFEEAKIKNEME